MSRRSVESVSVQMHSNAFFNGARLPMDLALHFAGPRSVVKLYDSQASSPLPY